MFSKATADRTHTHEHAHACGGEFADGCERGPGGAGKGGEVGLAELKGVGDSDQLVGKGAPVVSGRREGAGD